MSQYCGSGSAKNGVNLQVLKSQFKKIIIFKLNLRYILYFKITDSTVFGSASGSA